MLCETADKQLLVCLFAYFPAMDRCQINITTALKRKHV